MDDFVDRLAHSVGKNLRGAKRTFDRRIGRTENPHIVAYRGYGNESRMLVLGRTLRDPGLTEAGATDNWVQNLVNSYKRIETDELPGAHVRATISGTAHDIVSDSEGFFRASLPLSSPPPPDADYWHGVHLQLVEPVVDAPPTAVAQVMLPPSQAEFGIISDLDDTVIQTGATNVLRMARATLLGNARTRSPFAGVAAFYAALQRGSTGTAFNPIFYVSSSPWNLYDVIEQFMVLQRIPAGPTLLRDWGMSLERIPFGHAAHKVSSIRHIFEMYPHMRFVLIGDSGQQDPEIYREVTREFPGRVAVCYIRNVTAGVERARSLSIIAAEIEEAGSKLFVAPDTVTVAEEAVKSGFIAENSLVEIAQEKRKDKS